MAEGQDGESSGGWWGSWIQAAKEKSASAYEMVKKDLSEFTCTMTSDTSQAVVTASDKLKDTLKTENTTAAKDRLRNGITTFLEGLSKSLVIEAEDKELPATARDHSDPVFDRAKARLHAIQADLETYCNPPSGSKKFFTDWENSFELEAHKGDISELLVSKVEVRAFYTKLVPAEISHGDFWKRYFYKVHQLQLDEARKLALMKRAEQAQTKEDSIGWEDDWSGDDEPQGKGKTDTEKKVCEPKALESESTNNASTESDCPVECKVIDAASESNSTSSQKESKCENEEMLNQSAVIKHDMDLSDKPSLSVQDSPDSSNPDSVIDQGSDSLKDYVPHSLKNDESDSVMDSEPDSVKDNEPDSPEDNALNLHKDSGPDSPKDKGPDLVQNSILALHISNLHDLKNTEQDDESIPNTVESKTEKSNPHVQSDKENKQKVNIQSENQVSPETKIDKQEGSTKVTEVYDGGLRTKVKGELVVVNPDRDSPSSDSSANKESLDDDWEQDFDVELTEEDMKAADEIAKKLNINASDYTKLAGELEDDWESWE